MTQIRDKPKEQEIVHCRECGTPMIVAKGSAKHYCNACDTPEVKLRERTRLLKEIREEK